MAQPLHRQYLIQARRLAHLDAKRPQQGNLRRAVSTAYYALFHFLVDRSSRFLVGSRGERERLRKLLTRSYGHTEMAAAARTFNGGTLPATVNRILGPINVSRDLRRLAEFFVHAQDRRHLADYDLATTFARRDVLNLINLVDQAFNDWDTICEEPATEAFLVSLLIWDRVRNK